MESTIPVLNASFYSILKIKYSTAKQAKPTIGAAKANVM
jgi:hypothetical protein